MASDKPDLFLYWASGSPPCWRAMLVLELKGFSDYPNKLITIEKGEHRSEDILKWNPRGQVPTLVIDNSYAINESLAVCEYFERVYPNSGRKLLPDDPVALGRVLQRKYEFPNFEARGRECVLYDYQTKPEDFNQVVWKQKLDAFFEEVERWEQNLAQTVNGQSTEYLTTNEWSMADVVFFPNLAFFVRLGLELDPKYPNLLRYYNKMIEEPSVKKTWPPHWHDSPDHRKLFVPA